MCLLEEFALAEHDLRCSFPQHLPFLEDNHDVRPFQCELHVMRGDDNRVAVGVQSIQEPDQPVRHLWVEPGGRFVRHDDLRLHGQHTGDGDPLLLPEAQQVGRPLGKLFDMRIPYRLSHPFADGCLGQAEI